MAYIPTEWFSGDTITAEKLNHIEEGIHNSALPDISPDMREKIHEGLHGPILTVGESTEVEASYTTLEDMLNTGGDKILATDYQGKIVCKKLSDVLPTVNINPSDVDKHILPDYYAFGYDVYNDEFCWLGKDEINAIINFEIPDTSPSPDVNTSEE